MSSTTSSCTQTLLSMVKEFHLIFTLTIHTHTHKKTIVCTSPSDQVHLIHYTFTSSPRCERAVFPYPVTVETTEISDSQFPPVSLINDNTAPGNYRCENCRQCFENRDFHSMTAPIHLLLPGLAVCYCDIKCLNVVLRVIRVGNKR